MEAARVPPGPGPGPGPREADVAPAPDPTGGRAAGVWAPADPGPLGLAGFALTTFLLSMVNANLVSKSSLGAVLAVAIAYGGIAQLLAGMWEFRTGNTFGAVAFSSYGAFWISFYFLGNVTGKEVTPHGLALYLFAWGGFTAYMFLASLRTTGAIALVFILLAVTFVLLGLGNIGGGHPNLLHAGGGVGIATAAAAWYASFAAVMNSTFGRVILPVIPLRRV